MTRQKRSIDGYSTSDILSRESDSDYQPKPLVLPSKMKRPSSAQTSRTENNKRAKITRGQPPSTSRPQIANVLERDRPHWPLNNSISADESLARIKVLDSGDDNEKLMALFARHVINPGRYRRTGSRWVSRRSLYHAFPEHFDKSGFIPGSSWKKMKAAEFGLPDLFLRGTDDEKARVGLEEDTDHLFADVGKTPIVTAMTDLEYERMGKGHWKRQQDLHDEKPTTLTQAARSENQVLSSLDDSTQYRDESVEILEERFQVKSSLDRPMFIAQQSQELSTEDTNRLRMTTEAPLTATFHTKSAMLLPASQDNGREVRTLTTPSLGDGYVDKPPHQRRRSAKDILMDPAEQQQIRDVGEPTTKTRGSTTGTVVSPNVNSKDKTDSRSLMVTRISEILQGSPTAYQDAEFLDILSKHVQACTSKDDKLADETYLDLLVHTATKITRTVWSAEDLLRAVFGIQEKHRRFVSQQAFKLNRNTATEMYSRENMHGLRVMLAQYLVCEARQTLKATQTSSTVGET